MVADVKLILFFETPHVVVHWRPDFGRYKAVLLSDERESAPAALRLYSNGRRSSDTPIDDEIAGVWSELMAAWEEDSAEDLGFADALNAGVCRLGEAMLSMLMHRDAEGTVIDHGTLHSLDVVYVRWTHLHLAMGPDKLPKQSSIAETLERLMCKCKGRPHWGKNHERVFRHPDCKLVESFPAANVAALLEMQRQHDPAKVFEPELFGQLLQKAGPEYSDLCTAHFWCYCEVECVWAFSELPRVQDLQIG